MITKSSFEEKLSYFSSGRGHLSSVWAEQIMRVLQTWSRARQKIKNPKMSQRKQQQQDTFPG